nr:MAG: hypothetical protein BECKTC1821F_GA0114240_100356 [Candidatus Kentron sp. TC]
MDYTNIIDRIQVLASSNSQSDFQKKHKKNPMVSIPFDTHRFVETLRKSGVEERQAAAHQGCAHRGGLRDQGGY